jgi:hypothetical protein
MDITSSIELVNKINKLKKVKVQSGGVFSLISAIGGVYGYVVGLVIRIIKAVMYFLFIPKDIKWGKVPDDRNEYKEYLKSNIFQQFYIKYIPKFEAPTQYANFWKFIWFSLKSGVYISIGFLGGIIVSLVGIIYMYANLIKEFFSMTPQTDDN